MKTMTTKTTNKQTGLEKELTLAKAKVDALQADIEKQQKLAQELVALEQKNDSSYKEKLAIQAAIDAKELDIAKFATLGKEQAELIIELVSQKNELEKKIKEAVNLKTEYAVMTFFSIFDTHILKKTLDKNFRLEEFVAVTELTKRYPYLFNATPVEVANFIRNARIVIERVKKKYNLSNN